MARKPGLSKAARYHRMVLQDDAESEDELALEYPSQRARKKKTWTSRTLNGSFDSDADSVTSSDAVGRETRGRKRRRESSYESDTETLKKLGIPPPNPKSAEGIADQALRDVYRDIDNIFLTVGHQWMTWNYLNPFTEYPNWPGNTQKRYKHADENLEREYLAVAMHSKTYQTALKTFPDERWLLLFHRINANRESLRMFTLIRRIPYLRHYNNSKLPELVGRLNDHHKNADKKSPFGLQPPDEIFLRMQSGDIDEARIKGKKIQTVNEPVYKPAAFEGRKKPTDWPAKWPYPHNPTYAALSVDPPPPAFWPKCFSCELQVVSAKTARVMPANKRCTCRFAEDVANTPRPLVEIREFDHIPGDTASINRGVRALSSIKKWAIIGEYTGEFIHPDAVEDIDDYAFDFRPPTFIEKSGPGAGTEQDGWGKTSSLTAQVTGNWVGFINQSIASKSANNCMFRQYTVSGQMRIVIQARLDIRFGDELTCHYGMNYFKKEKPNKKRKTDKGAKK